VRRPLLAVSIVVLLVVALDVGARRYTETWVAGQIRTAFGLNQEPGVSLGGFPFIAEVARGRMPTVEVDADRFDAEGLRVRGLHLDLTSVRFPVGRLLSRGAATYRVARGRGQATISARDLAAFLAFEGRAARVRFRPGVAVVEGSVGTPFGNETVRAVGPLSIRGGRLVFEPERASAGGASIRVGAVAFSFDLPRPFPGFHYRDIRVGRGQAVVTIRVRDGRIRVQPEE
jgi:hypothetical protein